jgi:DNA-binding MarR family transcriptional regulator
VDELSGPSQEQSEQAAAARLAPLGDVIDFEAFQAVWLLHQAADAARQFAVTEVLDDMDVSWTQFEVLWNMWIFGEHDAGWVAQAAMISKSGLTGVLGQLQKRQLVTRRTSEADRRKVLVRLSPKGTAFMERLFPRYNQAEAQFSSNHTAQQKSELIALLRLMASSRPSAVEEPPGP